MGAEKVIKQLRCTVVHLDLTEDSCDGRYCSVSSSEE